MHIQSVQIDLPKAGAGGTASTYTLSDAVIAGFDNSDGVEQLSFGFARVEVSAGGTSTCFNVTSHIVC